MTSSDAMPMSELRASAAIAQVYLRGIDYPVNKQGLIEHAQGAGAPDGVMQVLDMLPDAEYSSSVEVRRKIDEVTLISAYESNRGVEGDLY